MTPYVVDASVAVKWYLPEVHDVHSKRLLNGTNILLAPDLIYSEVGNILWKRVRFGDLTKNEAEKILASLGRCGLIISPSWPLVLLALELACQTQRSVYDSLYLSLAIREGALFVTADEKFYNAIQATPLNSHVLWIEDVP